MRQTETDLLSEMRVRLEFETMLTDISTRFVNLPADKIDGEIDPIDERQDAELTEHVAVWNNKLHYILLNAATFDTLKTY
ncbi:MAG: hypothetical protein WBR24_02865 [Desulfobacterales bacterium]